jgi:hypothetical protein
LPTESRYQTPVEKASHSRRCFSAALLRQAIFSKPFETVSVVLSPVNHRAKAAV